MLRLSWRTLCTATIVAASAASSGCAAQGRATPVGYAGLYYGTTYQYYPHAYYGGRDVYFIDGRWMYLDGGTWRYYETEPEPLYRYRSTIRRAPPAPRYHPRSEPTPSQEPPSSSAPPPTRVR